MTHFRLMEGEEKMSNVRKCFPPECRTGDNFEIEGVNLVFFINYHHATNPKATHNMSIYLYKWYRNIRDLRWRYMIQNVQEMVRMLKQREELGQRPPDQTHRK